MMSIDAMLAFSAILLVAGANKSGRRLGGVRDNRYFDNFVGRPMGNQPWKLMNRVFRVSGGPYFPPLQKNGRRKQQFAIWLLFHTYSGGSRLDEPQP